MLVTSSILVVLTGLKWTNLVFAQNATNSSSGYSILQFVDPLIGTVDGGGLLTTLCSSLF